MKYNSESMLYYGNEMRYKGGDMSEYPGLDAIVLRISSLESQVSALQGVIAAPLDPVTLTRTYQDGTEVIYEKQ